MGTRLERRHEVAQNVNDELAVAKSDARLQGSQTQRQRFVRDSLLLRDKEPRVARGRETFAQRKNLFEELLSGTDASLHDPDIAVGRQTRQRDERLRQVQDVDGLTHVEHQYLAVASNGHGLQYERHRFGNGHEVALHVTVRDRDWPAVLDLLLENRNYAAAAFQYVAKAHGDELRACLVHKRLRDDLRQPFSDTHDAGGVDGFVRGQKDKLGGTCSSSSQCHHMGAQNVVAHGLAGDGLDDRHVFVFRRLEDDVRPVFREHVADARSIGHVGQDYLRSVEPELQT